MYSIIRDLLFLFPPENVHHFSMNSLHFACNNSVLKKIIQKQFGFQHTSLHKKVFGLNFINPVGLAAGFDKNAIYLNELQALGFGFAEIGTVTPLPQNGNDRPRLFRLPKDKAIINRMGFNNHGVKVIKERLEQWKNHQAKDTINSFIVGGNIGKNKITPNENAWQDYKTCFNELFNVVDYFVVNVSSPNTPNLRALQEKDALLKILGELQNINAGKKNAKPLLLKIAPDLNEQQLNDIVEISLKIPLHGLVATNTTIERNNLITPEQKIKQIGAGGLSGKPLTKRSTDIVKFLVQATNNKIPVIASGGIFNGNDAKEKLNAGASLIQVYTGFIYEGPSVVKNICKELVK